MKKLTFLFLSLVVVCSYGQVSINENFDSGTPAGWTDSYLNTTSQVCSGQSERDNLYSGSSSGNMTSPNQVAASNGTDITFSIDYKVVDWSAATTATADGWGNAQLQYSTDNGTNWTTAGTIDDSNDSNSNVCTTFSVTILGASVPTGSDLRFRVLNTWAAGDYYFYIDNFTATQAALTPPNCDSSLTSATTDFGIADALTWSAATGGLTGYKISVGSTMGGTDIANNVDVGLTTSYSPAGLSYSTTYYTTITPYNANGDATGCTEESFAVEAAPPIGTVCNNPFVANTLPYTATGETTAGFGDDYSGSPGSSGCGSTSSYLNGDDIVYSHTAAADGSIDVVLTNITDNYTGVFIYNDCADIGTSCAAGDTNGFSTADLEILNFPVTNGSTYYIVVSTWASPQTTTYDLSITAGATCFDVSGLTLDSVSTTSATISWTAAGSETNWEIAVQADGTGTPGTADGSGTDTATNPHTESGLSPSTDYEVYVRAECTAGTDFGGWIGPLDFTTDALCPDVSGITIDSFTSSSVTVSWTNGGTEDDWEVLVQADGTGSPSSGTATTTNPYTESGLSGNTAYEVYVRADCTDASNGYSQWVGPVDFTTACSAYTPDYTEDFTTFLDVCWDEATGGDLTSGPSATGAGAWTADDFANGGGSDAAKINFFGSGPDVDWLLTPSFDLSADGYELVFDSSIVDWNGTTLTDTFNAGDVVQLVYSTDGTNWIVLYDLITNIPAAAGETITVDLTGITSTTVQFAIYTEDDATNTSGRDLDIFVDNFIVRTPPACPDVTAINVTNISATGADIGWTNGGTETDWDVAIQAQGTGTPSGSGAATTTNPYPAVGLTAQTNYEVYVRSNCGGGDLGNWIGPINFTTLCATVSTFPFFEDFEGNGDVIPDCWSEEIESGTASWVFNFDGDAGGSGTSNDAYSGSRNALLRDFDTADDFTKLVTPAMDLTGLTNPELVFWHTQELWSPDQDELSVYYKTSAGGSWTLLASYTADLPDWTQETLALPSPSADYYIAFEGNAKYGRGVALDDVLVWDNVPTTFTYTAGTWSPANPMGLATVDDDIVIAAGDASVGSDLSCNTMTVNPGAGLTVDSGVTLTTANGLTLESSSTSYSSLILDGTVVGDMDYERHVNINGSGTTGSNDLVSAPLTGQAFNAFATANPNILNNGTLYLFGPFEKATGQYVNWPGTETATLDAGVGYRAGTTDNGTVTFTGTAENGTITNDIINGGTNNEEWNLVGNPYPSYISVQDFLNHDVGGVTNIQLFDTPTAGIYGYDGSALNGWTIYNLANTTASTVIAPGQGFMVSANAANTAAYDLEFDPSIRRTGSSDDFIVGRNAELVYLHLNLSSNTKAYNTEFYFNTNASKGFDLGYDANIWGDTAPEFALYSHLVEDNAGDPVTLQALSSTDLNDVTIPLGVNANQGEQLTFSIADMNLPASVKVYLEDTVKNTVTLLNDSDYVITPTTPLSGTGRFYLRTSNDALSHTGNSIDMLEIYTLKASSELVISGELFDSNAGLTLYDVQGRLVLETELDNTLLQNRIDVSSINSGVYIVTVIDNGQEKTKKVIIE